MSSSKGQVYRRQSFEFVYHKIREEALLHGNPAPSKRWSFMAMFNWQDTCLEMIESKLGRHLVNHQSIGLANEFSSR